MFLLIQRLKMPKVFEKINAEKFWTNDFLRQFIVYQIVPERHFRPCATFLREKNITITYLLSEKAQFFKNLLFFIRLVGNLYKKKFSIFF